MYYSFSEFNDSDSSSKINSEENDDLVSANTSSSCPPDPDNNSPRNDPDIDAVTKNSSCQTSAYDTRDISTSTGQSKQVKSSSACSRQMCKCCSSENNSKILENLMSCTSREDRMTVLTEPTSKINQESRRFSKRTSYIKKLNIIESKKTNNEAWLMSPEGQALKVKCILVTKELPEYKGTGMHSTVKFLHEIKEILLKAGVPEEDWVTLAASRVKGDLQRAWYEENTDLDPNWEQFTKFILKKLNDIRENRREETRIMKRRCIYTNEAPFKNKKLNY